ncbi:MAG: amidohydrolase [Mycoplasmataceae bacterium]|nr:amidohydrolase [Mycoplasmataceae bacterium]
MQKNLILIKNCTLIAVDLNQPIVQRDVDILIEDTKIKSIGKDIVAQGAKIIDGQNKYVTPGFINCHAHIPMSVFREAIDGYGLQDWLTKAIWPIENKLNIDDIYWFSLLSMYESLSNGVTTINDMYFLTEGIIKAKHAALINLYTTITLMDIDGESNGKKRWDNFINMVEKYPNENIIMSFHGLNTCSPKYIQTCVEAYKNFQKNSNAKSNLLHIHFCENTQEVADTCKKHNITVPSVALQKYFKDFKLILAHAVKTTSADLDILKQLNCTVCHDPVSNLRLGSGVCDIIKLREHGINVCLGTDGQGSGSNLSMLKEMRLACLLPKGLKENPSIINAYDALQMATINGAKALGIEKSKGSVSIGKDADLNIFNFKAIEMFPVNDVVSDLVYNANSEDIETVIVGGKIIIENHAHVLLKKEEITKKCAELINEIKKRQ